MAGFTVGDRLHISDFKNLRTFGTQTHGIEVEIMKVYYRGSEILFDCLLHTYEPYGGEGNQAVEFYVTGLPYFLLPDPENTLHSSATPYG